MGSSSAPTSSSTLRHRSPPERHAPAPSVGSSFRPDVEGLRGIAVLLVVLFHVGIPGFGGGFVGVDVFFALSGYLITGLLVGEIERTGRLGFVEFYARRVRRLLPAAALVLAAVVVASAVVYPPFEQLAWWRSELVTALYLSNVWFARISTDYFAAGAEANPLLHTWSLAVEEQFYLVWPVLVALGLRGAIPRRRLARVLAGLALVSFASAVWLTAVRPSLAFFGTPMRAWEFALGGLASLVPAAVVLRHRRPLLAIGWSGLALILGAGTLIRAGSPFPGVLALPPVLGCVLVLLAGSAAPGEGVGRLLGAAPLQVLGRLSYAWYLWHWPVLVMVPVAVPGLTSWGRVLCAVGALLLAALTHGVVENPIRFHRGLVARPRLSLGLGVALTVVSATGVLAAKEVAASASVALDQVRFTVAAGDGSRLDAPDCTAGWYETAPKECAFGDPAAGTTVVLLGDSHAAQWFPALERAAAADRGWRVVTLVKSACAWARIPVYNPTLGRDYRECAPWREAALRRVVELSPEVVLLAHSPVYVQGPARAGEPGRVTPGVWRDGVRSTLETLGGAGVEAVVVRATPLPGVHVPACLARAEHRPAWYAEDGCATPRDRAIDARTVAAERAAMAGLETVEVLDLTDRFCGPAVCEPIRNGLVVYRDDSHLTATFARSLAPVLGARLDRFVPDRTPSASVSVPAGGPAPGLTGHRPAGTRGASRLTAHSTSDPPRHW